MQMGHETTLISAHAPASPCLHLRTQIIMLRSCVCKRLPSGTSSTALPPIIQLRSRPVTRAPRPQVECESRRRSSEVRMEELTDAGPGVVTKRRRTKVEHDGRLRRAPESTSRFAKEARAPPVGSAMHATCTCMLIQDKQVFAPRALSKQIFRSNCSEASFHLRMQLVDITAFHRFQFSSQLQDL